MHPLPSQAHPRGSPSRVVYVERITRVLPSAKEYNCLNLHSPTRRYAYPSRSLHQCRSPKSVFFDTTVYGTEKPAACRIADRPLYLQTSAAESWPRRHHEKMADPLYGEPKEATLELGACQGDGCIAIESYRTKPGLHQQSLSTGIVGTLQTGVPESRPSFGCFV